MVWEASSCPSLLKVFKLISNKIKPDLFPAQFFLQHWCLHLHLESEPNAKQNSKPEKKIIISLFPKLSELHQFKWFYLIHLWLQLTLLKVNTVVTSHWDLKTGPDIQNGPALGKKWWHLNHNPMTVCHLFIKICPPPTGDSEICLPKSMQKASKTNYIKPSSFMKYKWLQ